MALMISATFTFGTLASAAPEKKSAAEVKVALKERLKSGIKKETNGDVIVRLPMVDIEKAKSYTFINPILTIFLSYIDPEMDFENLNKNLEREIGKKKDKVPISKIMSGISKGLARNNMQLQKMGFSEGNVIKKLDEGVPLIAWLTYSDIYEKKLLHRTEKRATVGNMVDWEKELRSAELRKIVKGRVFSYALIMGYNKESGEFLVFGLSKKPVWMTQKEVKQVLLEAYQLRY